MKTRHLSLALIFSLLIINTNLISSNYLNNKAPLQEVPFIALPVGAVKAEGWLHNQLLLQKNGLTGHAETLYSHDHDLGPGCDWLGGTGDSWERAPYYTKGLIALAYVLDDDELKTKAQKWIDWSLDNQRRNGFFGPPNNNDWWARMPMLYAIRDYYDATGDERVIPFFTKYFQYQHANLSQQPLSSWGRSRAGDNIDIIFWLYNRTGDAFLLELADQLHEQAYPWTDIFTYNLFNHFEKDFQPKHNVNVPQAMKMPVVFYQKSKDDRDRNAYVIGREQLMRDHGQPYGMQSGSEMLSGKSSMTGLELCSVVEQMQTSEIAQMILGDASIGDQLEKVAYNALPGGLSYDITGLQYYQHTNQVVSKFGYAGFGQNYDNGNMPSPFSGYGCCRFDFHMGYPYFVKTMWAATADNGLAVMAYGPSTVTAKVADGVEVTIKEETDYPFDEYLNFTISSTQNVRFPLKFRIPAWCTSPEIKVNGTVQKGIENETFYTIDRTWKDKDIVSIHFPMELVVNDEVNNSVSIHRGPIVYSLKIEEDWRPREQYGNGFAENEVFPISAWNFALILDKENPASSIEVIKSSMPDHPYYQAATPVQLRVSAKKLNAWEYAHHERLATDPPYGPVESHFREEKVTLVPYGAQTLRVTCMPYIGTPKRITTTFTEDFSEGQNGWVQYGGSWYVKDGEYTATNTEASHPASKSVFTATLFDDFVYEADVQLNSANGDAGLIFRTDRLAYGPDDYNGYYVGLSAAENSVILGKANGGWSSLTKKDFDVQLDKWYRLKVVAEKQRIQVFIDEMQYPIIDFTDGSFTTGSIGIRSWSALARWDNIDVKSLNNTYVQNTSSSKDIFIYPNPTNEQLSVNLLHSGLLSIYNLEGKGVYEKQLPAGVTKLNTSNFSEGIYVVQLINDNGVSHVQFIKKHA